MSWTRSDVMLMYVVSLDTASPLSSLIASRSVLLISIETVSDGESEKLPPVRV